MTTGFVWHERYMWHETPRAVAGVLLSRGVYQPGTYFENPETKRRFKNLLDGYDITPMMSGVEPHPVDDDVLLRFHTKDYLAKIKEMSDGMGGNAGESAWFGPGSNEIARLGVGGTIAAIDATIDESTNNAYALVRPCGHHAERDRGRGFCIYSNVAVAIMDAIASKKVERVAVVDWDVHHGNGTEQAFYDNGDVLTISIHQDKLYPTETGAASDRGEGKGVDKNINIPLPPGSGGGAYMAVMDRVVLPALHEHKPELIVVACGFDASYFDPLGHQMLLSNHFRAMTEKLKVAAAELCSGRLVLSHEGGYSAEYVPFCGVATIEALLGINAVVVDPLAIETDVDWQLLQPHQEAIIDSIAKDLNL